MARGKLIFVWLGIIAVLAGTTDVAKAAPCNTSLQKATDPSCHDPLPPIPPPPTDSQDQQDCVGYITSHVDTGDSTEDPDSCVSVVTNAPGVVIPYGINLAEIYVGALIVMVGEVLVSSTIDCEYPYYFPSNATWDGWAYYATGWQSAYCDAAPDEITVTAQVRANGGSYCTTTCIGSPYFDRHEATAYNRSSVGTQQVTAYSYDPSNTCIDWVGQAAITGASTNGGSTADDACA